MGAILYKSCHLIILEIHQKTIIAKLQDLYPECSVLIQGYDRLSLLGCFKDTCHRDAGCLDKLAKRVKAIFDSFEFANMLLVVFRDRDNKKIKAGVFWRNFKFPKLINVNPYGWQRITELSTQYEWAPPRELFGIVST